MLRRLILAAALAAGLASPAPAQTMGQATTLYDLRGQPVGIATNPLSVMQAAGSSQAAMTSTGAGGVAAFSRIPSSAATTNLTQAKAAAGRVYKFVACNTTTTAARVKFYNALSASVAVGTTPPLFTRPIPAAASTGGLACVSYDMADLGWSFSTGISFALTTGAADSDATAVAAGAITDLSVEYQ